MHITLVKGVNATAVLDQIRGITPFMETGSVEDGQIVLNLGEAGIDPRWFEDLLAIDGVNTAIMDSEKVFRCPLGRKLAR